MKARTQPPTTPVRTPSIEAQSQPWWESIRDQKIKDGWCPKCDEQRLYDGWCPSCRQEFK